MYGPTRWILADKSPQPIAVHLGGRTARKSSGSIQILVSGKETGAGWRPSTEILGTRYGFGTNSLGQCPGCDGDAEIEPLVGMH